MIKSKKRIPFESSGSKNHKNKTFEFLYSHALEPHPQKVQQGGQDALFVSKNVLVLADGVGGWKQMGIDAGEYSKQLMNIIQNLLLEEQKRKYYIQNPQKLISTAVNLNTLKGSTTITVITLHPITGIVRTYYLGDSLYGIFSQVQANNEQHQQFISIQQQNGFNQPHQVGSKFYHQNQLYQFCNPTHGIYNQFSYEELCHKIIILGSDGLWDNLFPDNIHKIIQNNLKIQKQNKQNAATTQENHSQKVLNEISYELVKEIKKTYQKKQYASPFYYKALKAGLQIQKYAKIDDISIIVAQIGEIQSNELSNNNKEVQQLKFQ